MALSDFHFPKLSFRSDGMLLRVAFIGDELLHREYRLRGWNGVCRQECEALRSGVFPAPAGETKSRLARLRLTRLNRVRRRAGSPSPQP